MDGGGDDNEILDFPWRLLAYLPVSGRPAHATECRLSACWRFHALKQEGQEPMTYEPQAVGLLFAVFMTIGAIVKHDRKVKRWLLKRPRRRRKALRRPVLF